MYNNTAVLTLVCKNCLEKLHYLFVCLRTAQYKQIDHLTSKFKLENKRRGISSCKVTEKFRRLRRLSLVLCFHEAGVNLDQCCPFSVYHRVITQTAVWCGLAAVRASSPMHNPHQNKKADLHSNMFVCNYHLSLEVGRTKTHNHDSGGCLTGD